MLKISHVIGVLLAVGVNNFAAAAQPTPYAGQERREIKALSPGEIQDYLAGKGMGLAKAAELNRYPGPAHVLELADKLGLDEEQRVRSEAIFKAMQAQAIRQGKTLVEKERELDRLFAEGGITGEDLRAALEQIGHLQAEVRRIHLQAHIEQWKVLTEQQIARYEELRGYASHAGRAHQH
jgi:Spy/CpxP family protein refolding chaperone